MCVCVRMCVCVHVCARARARAVQGEVSGLDFSCVYFQGCGEGEGGAAQLCRCATSRHVACLQNSLQHTVRVLALLITTHMVMGYTG